MENFTSSLDREANERFSIGRSETQKIAKSDNPPTKVVLFWSRHDSKRVTGTGYYAWTSCRMQGKPQMHWLDSKEATGLWRF